MTDAGSVGGKVGVFLIIDLGVSVPVVIDPFDLLVDGKAVAVAIAGLHEASKIQ